jgi:hypothetical protein
MRGSNRLTAIQVSKLSRPGRYCDGLGLWLQVSNAGKSWLFRFTPPHHTQWPCFLHQATSRLNGVAGAQGLPGSGKDHSMRNGRMIGVFVNVPDKQEVEVADLVKGMVVAR